MRTPLQKGEKILLVTYSSWTLLVLPVLIALAGIVAAYFIGFFDHYGWIAAVVGILYFLWKYMDWKVNIWVVTNFRVIDESGLLSHHAKESPLDKINNVSYDMAPLGRIFNYGHVEIQTAAEVGATDYYNVNHPRRLKDTITAAQSDYKAFQSTAQARQMAAAFHESLGQAGGSGHATPAGIAAELEKLFDLKQKGALTEEEYLKAKNRLLGH
ncbi:MAG: PH domain-containing protein [Chitinophagaceae bacterium]|nr:PH domain-containing protein [Chitinophagaceae bacterium]